MERHGMSARRKVLVALCGTLAAPYASLAQQPARIPRIAYVSGRIAPSAANPDSNADALRQGLRELGYIEGKNIVIEYRYVAGLRDRAESAVAELMHVDVLVTPYGQTLQAAKQASKTPPVVMITTEDPVATGLVASLARPGGRITGVTRLTHELASKRLDLLKELIPGLSRVSVLTVGNPTEVARNYLEIGAHTGKLQLDWIEVQAPAPDYESAFKTAVNHRAGAVLVRRHGLMLRYQKQIGALTVKYRVPTMFEGTEEVAAGGLISYATSDVESFRRAASYVDRILKGAKPADLPVEQPARFEIAINMKTAQAIGISIPQTIYLRADKIFE